MVFSGIYPASSEDYEDLREALRKLALNDSSLTYEPETSAALGFGFRCGFLGLLHMEIAQERLEREFKIDLITTAPSVVYDVHLKDGGLIKVDNPSQLPSTSELNHIEEPYIRSRIFTPQKYARQILVNKWRLQLHGLQDK